MKIQHISAREILDSRGNPTISTTVELTDGVIAEASVPSGASTGAGEDVELRDGQKDRFGGLGELGAVKNVNTILGPQIMGRDARDQEAIDQFMCELDGTDNKAKLGANAILSISLAIAKAQAISDGLELFEYLATLYTAEKATKFGLPTPMFNILNGGKHSKNNVDIQEIMIVPVGPKSFEEKLRAGSEIYHLLSAQLSAEGYYTGLGDEGGFAPDFKNNEAAIAEIHKAIEASGYGDKKVRISLDVAATELYDETSQKYLLEGKKKSLSAIQMITRVAGWVKKYNFLSVEDGLAEHDPSWTKLKEAIAPSISIGDDLFTTNPARIAEGLEHDWAGGVIIKPNQIGTLSETMEAIRVAQKGGLKIIISHRSGETEDSFIADLAVAVGAEYIKSGAPARSERLAKYNRLTAIEDYVSESY